MIVRLRKHLGIFAMLSALAACSQQAADIPQGQVKIGKPYVIDGKTYYPEYDPDYDKTGQASWYGPGFHGKYTANGEVFNQDDLTAAHPTLPMPSLVRVTNLDNGKSLIVRINDRGPFKSNRIIDLSKGSAQKLGIKGLTDVRIQFLKEETAEYLKNYNGSKPVDMIALNENIGSKQSFEPEPMGTASGAPVDAIAANDLSSPTGGNTVVALAEPAPAPLNSAQPSAPAVVPASSFQPPPRVNQWKEPGQASQSQAALIREVWAEEDTPAKPVAVTRTEKTVTTTKPVELSYNGSAPQPATRVTTTKTTTTSVASVPESKAASISPASGGNFMIQVGSFSTEENAHKIKSKLSSIGSVAVDKVHINDKQWFRVRLGPYNDKPTAEAALLKVQSSGAPDARITRRS